MTLSPFLASEFSEHPGGLLFLVPYVVTTMTSGVLEGMLIRRIWQHNPAWAEELKLPRHWYSRKPLLRWMLAVLTMDKRLFIGSSRRLVRTTCVLAWLWVFFIAGFLGFLLVCWLLAWLGVLK